MFGVVDLVVGALDALSLLPGGKKDAKKGTKEGGAPDAANDATTGGAHEATTDAKDQA